MKWKIIALTVVVSMFVFAALAAGAGNLPLSVTVKCGGNCKNDDLTEGHFWADKGEKITLTVHTDGGNGKKNYLWTESGKQVSASGFYTMTVSDKESAIFLVVSDDGGSIKKTIKVFPKSEPVCSLPDFSSEIIIEDKIAGKTEWSVGSKFALRVKLNSEVCSGKIFWESDSDSVVLSNSSVKGKIARIDVSIVKQNAKGWAGIRAVITDGNVVRDRKFNIRIVDNTPPTLKMDYENPFSNSILEVDLSGSTTGSNGNENNDFFSNVSAELMKNGVVIDFVKITPNNKVIPLMGLHTSEIGDDYQLRVKITDSQGITVSETTGKFTVFEGNSKKDPLIMKVVAPNICYVNQKCKIDASNVSRRYDGNVYFRFYDITHRDKEELSNAIGGYCQSEICWHIFPYSGNYTIRVEAKSKNGRTGVQELTIAVIDNSTVVKPTPTITPKQTTKTASTTPQKRALISTSEPARKYPQESPTMIRMIFSAIAIVIALYAVRKK